jgi:hypothetical protein
MKEDKSPYSCWCTFSVILNVVNKIFVIYFI